MVVAENRIVKEIVDIAFSIHKQYGPGLFESVYEDIMCFELSKRNLLYSRQQVIPLVHETIKLDACFKADIC